MKLLVVESPNKCGKIKSFLGSGYTVEASVGHIRSLPPTKLSVDEKTFEPTFETDKKKSAVVKKIKDLAAEADTIYLATDPDREGEAISWHVLQILPARDRKKCTRITFTEITKKAVTDALANPREIDQNLVDAQMARQVLDRLIGYKVSPLVWRCVQRGTSAGRVQSTALRMIVERQIEVDAFKPEDYWFLDAKLAGKAKTAFTARVVTKEKDNRYKSQKVAEADLEALKKASYTLDKIERKEKATSPYPPFDTSSLQQACSSLFGWSATKTMTLAQDLYTGGHITYLRTDSYNMAKEAVDEVRAHIEESYKGALPDKPRFYAKKSSAAAQEAHECIRPTHVAITCPDGVVEDFLRLYELIRARFIACQMVDMIVDTVAYHIKADSGHDLIARGQSIKFEGWHQVYPYASVSDVFLPAATDGEALNLLTMECSKHSTQPPPKYNDGSLVKKMEEDGIGRPATRASIIKALQDKGYTDKDGKAFTPTDLGKRICGFLKPAFITNFMDYKYTAGLEEDLDAIANGEKTYLNVVKPVYETLKTMISTAKETTPKREPLKMGAKCPICNTGEVVERMSKFGKFFSCSDWPKCKAILMKNDDGTYAKKVSAAQANLTEEKCPDCGKFLSLRTNRKKGTQFFGCSAYPKCKYTRNA